MRGKTGSKWARRRTQHYSSCLLIRMAPEAAITTWSARWPPSSAATMSSTKRTSPRERSRIGTPPRLPPSHSSTCSATFSSSRWSSPSTGPSRLCSSHRRKCRPSSGLLTWLCGVRTPVSKLRHRLKLLLSSDVNEVHPLTRSHQSQCVDDDRHRLLLLHYRHR